MRMLSVGQPMSQLVTATTSTMSCGTGVRNSFGIARAQVKSPRDREMRRGIGQVAAESTDEGHEARKNSDECTHLTGGQGATVERREALRGWQDVGLEQILRRRRSFAVWSWGRLGVASVQELLQAPSFVGAAAKTRGAKQGPKGLLEQLQLTGDGRRAVHHIRRLHRPRREL